MNGQANRGVLASHVASVLVKEVHLLQENDLRWRFVLNVCAGADDPGGKQV